MIDPDLIRARITVAREMAARAERSGYVEGVAFWLAKAEQAERLLRELEKDAS